MTPEPTRSGFGVLGSWGGLGLWPGCPLSPESSAGSGWITYPCSSERPNERGSPLSAIAARRDAAAGSASRRAADAGRRERRRSRLPQARGSEQRSDRLDDPVRIARKRGPYLDHGYALEQYAQPRLLACLDLSGDLRPGFGGVRVACAAVEIE